MYTLLYLKWITNKDLSDSTGNSDQCYMATWMGEEFGGESVQFSHSVLSDTLRPHGLQHARLPCPSPTPGTCSNSYLSSRWRYPTISSSVVPLSCLQSFPASGSFPVSQFFTSGSQSIGASASASVLPMNIHYWLNIHWGRMDACKCIAELLCCVPETITALLISYIPYKIKS